MRLFYDTVVLVCYNILLCQQKSIYKSTLGKFLDTLGDRIKLIWKKSGKSLPEFANILGVSRHSLINYQKNRTYPDSRFLSTLSKLCGVNPTWLLLGEGEPFGQEVEPLIAPMAVRTDSDLVEQLLAEEEGRSGVSLSPDQRIAILKIFRELVSRDVRSIRALLQALTGGQNQGGK